MSVECESGSSGGGTAGWVSEWGADGAAAQRKRTETPIGQRAPLSTAAMTQATRTGRETKTSDTRQEHTRALHASRRDRLPRWTDGGSARSIRSSQSAVSHCHERSEPLHVHRIVIDHHSNPSAPSARDLADVRESRASRFFCFFFAPFSCFSSGQPDAAPLVASAIWSA